MLLDCRSCGLVLVIFLVFDLPSVFEGPERGQSPNRQWFERYRRKAPAKFVLDLAQANGPESPQEA